MMPWPAELDFCGACGSPLPQEGRCYIRGRNWCADCGRWWFSKYSRQVLGQHMRDAADYDDDATVRAIARTMAWLDCEAPRMRT